MPLVLLNVGGTVHGSSGLPSKGGIGYLASSFLTGVVNVRGLKKLAASKRFLDVQLPKRSLKGKQVMPLRRVLCCLPVMLHGFCAAWVLNTAPTLCVVRYHHTTQH